jgi:hypothetical protein
MIKSCTLLLGAVFITAASVLSTADARADVYNLKVVTDASPDYTDMDSLVHSITSRWDNDKDKMWALYYWMHKARRQTNPMTVHGKHETDPIRQANDYGYQMCSTISGVNMGIWQHMGYPAKYWDIGVHTVCEVFYDNAWHQYDNSLSIIYTLCDGDTIAGVEDIGKTLGCAASGGKEEPGHIAMYHALNGTSVKGFIEGADTMRELKKLGQHSFSPSALKYRYYVNYAELGHRYILNLRDGEVYARHYSRLDKDLGSEDKESEVKGYRCDPAYFTPNGTNKDGSPRDPESKNPRYRIRGNGVRTWTPPVAAKPGEDAIYKVEGANVITSMTITADSASALAISTTNGMTWSDVLNGSKEAVKLKLIDEVNGAYEVLVKARDAKNIHFEAITQLNSKTLPRLNVGTNTVYVGAGEQTGSIVVWPELQNDRYLPYAVEAHNIKTKKEHEGWNAVMSPQEKGEGYVIFRIDSPDDITRITQGARMYVRNPKSSISYEHSFDNGKTWIRSFTHDDTEQPWDDIHQQVTEEIPAGTKSVLFKYVLKDAGVYSIRMEANHKVPNTSATPLEVTFNWSERREDYSLVQRSHTQLVDKLPATYTVNVGGVDHPVVESLVINPMGARGPLTHGYSDGKDVGGEKWIGKWVTYGKNLAEGKPYTLSIPSQENNWGAGDPDGNVLTDGRVGSSYSGGTSYSEGPLWTQGQKPEITVDLEKAEKATVFRVHLHGYPYQDAIKGNVKDEVEVLVSNDGMNFTSAGKFDFRLRWKDIPENYLWNDEETFAAHNHTLVLDKPVEARYVKFAAKASRFMVVTEVQVLDGVKEEPFDIKIALPEARSRVAGMN